MFEFCHIARTHTSSLLRRLGATLLGCMLATVVSAAELLVVGDVARPYFQAFVSGLTESLNSRDENHRIVAAATDDPRLAQDMKRAALVVTLGAEAAQAVDALLPRMPVVHSLVTESFANEHHTNAAQALRYHLTLVLEQPIGRYLSLLKTTLPERRRIGVIYGPSTLMMAPRLRSTAAQQGYMLVEASISHESDLKAAMADMLGEVDILLALPDPVVVNANTARTLILDTYMRGVALVGYSQALTKAGALMALYTAPEQTGVQAGSHVRALLAGNRPASMDVYHPRTFRVSVNYQVARALGLNIPDEKTIEQEMRMLEMPR